jgi:dienelactone hydrolase
MSTPFTDAAGIPVNAPMTVASFAPIILKVAGRAADLELKVSVPIAGERLPVILLSHGHGAANFLSPNRGYGPLADFFAAHGFAVIQPTHLDSSALGLRDVDQPEGQLYWRSRATDMSAILDQLDNLEAAVPGLAGRLDRERVAVVGHSLGGHTASLLLGARTTDPSDGSPVDLTDSRIKTGIILAGPGVGDEHLSEGAREHFPILRYTDFTTMTAPALVVGGGKDLNPRFSDRLSYRWDAYTASPGPKTLLLLTDAEHMMGGISGYDAAETTDENPELVAALRALGWAYLRSTLYSGDPAWANATTALEATPEPIGTIQSK